MDHVLKIFLAHEGQVNLLEEGLACGIDLYGLLELAEVSPGLLDDLVRRFDECILLGHPLEVLVVDCLLLCEHLILRALSLVDCEEFLDHVQV